VIRYGRLFGPRFGFRQLALLGPQAGPFADPLAVGPLATAVAFPACGRLLVSAGRRPSELAA